MEIEDPLARLDARSFRLILRHDPRVTVARSLRAIARHGDLAARQFDVLGLGRNIPINTGNESEALLALKDGKWVVMRVPYPMGYFTKWMDGRIDNPNTGWKGRGLWTTISTRTPFHMEGGKGTTSKVMKFQLRPDPLAK